jgi:hypothetical protein
MVLRPLTYNELCVLKGTWSPDGLIYFRYVWIAIGLNRRHGWFLNFLGVSLICNLNNKIHCGKCKHKLAYNVSGVI